MAVSAEVVKKVLKIAERELSLSEYVEFLSAISPRLGDSVKEIREFRGKATHEEVVKRLKRRGAKIVP